jgi:hypothetical protein
MASIQDIRTVQNPQKSFMWEVEVQGLSTGNIPNMSFFARTVSIPQNAVEQIIINHKAGKTHHAGRDAAAHTVTVTFWDDESQTIHKYFSDWMDLMLNQETGSGVSRDLYSAEMVIRLKDSTDEVVTSTITLSTVFPTDVAEVALSYDSSEPVEHSITFSYDKKLIS